MSKKRFSGLRLILMVPVVVLLAGGLIIGGRALQEPGEVRTLKRQEVAQTDEGHQEYYFGLLNENEQRGYREILEGIRSFEDKFYLSLSGDNEIDRVYHAVLKDHPELFWVHNRILSVFSGIYLYRGAETGDYAGYGECVSGGVIADSGWC